MAAGTPSDEGRVRKGWAGGAEPDPGGRLLLVFGSASVPPASRCQRRSSSLPQFASERGYRPRPEEPPGPKQQFVPKRVKREAQHPQFLGNTAIVTSIGKECPPLHPPLIRDNSQSPGTCIKMDWCFGRKGRKHPPSQSSDSGNLAPKKSETKESADCAPHLHHPRQGPGLQSNSAPNRSPKSRKRLSDILLWRGCNLGVSSL